MDGFTLLRYWVLLGIGGALQGATIFMFFGTLPPPLAGKVKVNVNPVITAFLHAISWTIILVYGTQDLLQQTLDFFFK